jgi:hypothetical protein
VVNPNQNLTIQCCSSKTSNNTREDCDMWNLFAEGESLVYGKKHFANADQTGMSARHMSGCLYQQHKHVLQACVTKSWIFPGDNLQ